MYFQSHLLHGISFESFLQFFLLFSTFCAVIFYDAFRPPTFLSFNVFFENTEMQYQIVFNLRNEVQGDQYLTFSVRVLVVYCVCLLNKFDVTCLI